MLEMIGSTLVIIIWSFALVFFAKGLAEDLSNPIKKTE